MSAKAYKLKLAKISGKEYELSKKLLSFLPSSVLPSRIEKAVKKELFEAASASVEIEYHGYEIKTFEKFVDTSSLSSLAIIIAPLKLSKPIICQMDKAFAGRILDTSLGGTGEAVKKHMLSQTELGILDYLATRLLAAVCGSAGNKMTLQLDNILDDPRLLRPYSDKADVVEELKYLVRLGKEKHTVKIALPDPFISSEILSSEGKALGVDKEATAEFKKNLKRYGFMGVTLMAEAGKVTVNSDDIRRLETGDVIMLDQYGVKLEAGRAAGDVNLKVDDLDMNFKASLVSDGKRMKCKLVDNE